MRKVQPKGGGASKKAMDVRAQTYAKGRTEEMQNKELWIRSCNMRKAQPKREASRELCTVRIRSDRCDRSHRRERLEKELGIFSDRCKRSNRSERERQAKETLAFLLYVDCSRSSSQLRLPFCFILNVDLLLCCICCTPRVWVSKHQRQESVAG